MVMTRAEKDVQVGEIQQIFEEANSFFLVDLAGLSSNEINDLRASLREKGATMRVVKNRLAKRASADTPLSELEPLFVGPTALVYHAEEPISTAKSLVSFAKDHPNLGIKGGLVDRANAIDADGVKAVSELPGLDEIRSMLLSAINGPATKLVRLVNTPGQQLATVLQRRSEGEEGSAEAS
jgi:large subunit ribosomal protein L10